MTRNVLGNIVRVKKRMQHADLGYWAERWSEWISQSKSLSPTKKVHAGIVVIKAWT